MVVDPGQCEACHSPDSDPSSTVASSTTSAPAGSNSTSSSSSSSQPVRVQPVQMLSNGGDFALQLGGTAQAAVGVGGTVSVGVAVDNNLNLGLYFTLGFGVGFDISLGGEVVLSRPNVPTNSFGVENLSGTSKMNNISFLAGDVAWGTDTKNSNGWRPTQTTYTSMSVGASGPLPAGYTRTVENTGILPINY